MNNCRKTVEMYIPVMFVDSDNLGEILTFYQHCK